MFFFWFIFFFFCIYWALYDESGIHRVFSNFLTSLFLYLFQFIPVCWYDNIDIGILLEVT